MAILPTATANAGLRKSPPNRPTNVPRRLCERSKPIYSCFCARPSRCCHTARKARRRAWSRRYPRGLSSVCSDFAQHDAHRMVACPLATRLRRDGHIWRSSENRCIVVIWRQSGGRHQEGAKAFDACVAHRKGPDSCRFHMLPASKCGY